MKRFVLALSLVLFSAIGCVPSDQRVSKGVVSTPVKDATSGPAIEVAKTEIDLGDIPSDVHEVVGNIFFFNDGSLPLQIRKVHGPCACFAGYSGDKLLEPGQGGEIQVKFDTAKIQSGPVKRLVTIETNDPANKKVPVHFSFNIKRSKDEEELRILRSNLTAIRKDVRRLRSDMAKVLAELKSTKKSGAIKVTTSPRGKKQQAAKPKKKVDTTIYDVTVGNSPILGTKDAPVTVTEFVDLQCPYCIREFPKIQTVLKAYPDKVRVVFKHKPLGFHAKAKPAHAAVQLALQEKGNDAFWKMHDMIMEEPKKLDMPDLRGYAEGMGLDLVKFDELMASKDKINELLKADMAEAKKCNVRGTPTVMINGLKLADRSIAGYRARIDEILNKVKTKKLTKIKVSKDI